MSADAFEHRLAAHCETGTVRGILGHQGLRLSEPMVFGIGAGLFFGYFALRRFSFHKFVCRSRPGTILRKAVKRLGVKGQSRRFRSPERARAELHRHLDEGVPVSLQVDMFHMEYMPSHMRIHFNAHFINVIGRENGAYRVSDAYVPRPSTLSARALERARFVQGDMAPRGFLFRPLRVPADPPLEKAVRAGIRDACFGMLRIPFGPLGVRGIRRFAGTLPRWPSLVEDEDRLAHETCMIAVTLEDMGTGGGGFRFLYATFLQEASELLGSPALGEMSERMRENGDRWRDISLLAARTGRERDFRAERFAELARLVSGRADAEEALFRDLRRAL